MTGVKKLISENIDVWTSAVSLKSTSGRGTSNKLSLTGINKLRELILGLGLAGKLTPENFSLDINISEKIKTAREKYSLDNNRKLKDYKLGKPLLHEFSIPKGWKWKRVSELCDLQTGATPSKQHPEYFGGDNRWLVSGDINRFIIEDCEGRITDEGLNKSNCKILPEKTVMIALNGQGKTRATVALLKVNAACNQSLVGMIPFFSDILDSTFLLYALKYRYFEIRDITGQNQRRGLNMGLVAELSLPLPPIAEQKLIVEKIDELMALCDQLEQQTEASIDAHQLLVEELLSTLTNSQNTQEFAQNWAVIAEHFDLLITTEHSIEQLKQTILQLAVMGKLVPQDPSEEPASKLLERIAQEKEQLIKGKVIKKQKTLPEITDGEKPHKIPEGWQYERIGVFGVVGTGATPSRAKNEYWNPAEINWVSSGETSNLFVSETKEKVSELAIKETNVSIYPKGTLIVAMYGQGKTRGQITELLVDAGTNQACAAIRLIDNSNYHKDYVKLFFRKAYLELRSHAAGGAQPNLNVGKVSSTIVPLPPLKEQKRIVAAVNSHLAICDELSNHLEISRKLKSQLAEAIAEQALSL